MYHLLLNTFTSLSLTSGDELFNERLLLLLQPPSNMVLTLTIDLQLILLVTLCSQLLK